MDANSLHIYEEIGLLALRDRKGTFATERVEFLVAGAVLAELLLERVIAVGDGDGDGDGGAERRVSVSVGAEEAAEAGPEDPILALGFAEIAGAAAGHSLKEWVERLAWIEDLRSRVAVRLRERGILRMDEKSVLLIFSRKVYPEVDHAAEQGVLDRVRAAVFAEDPEAPVDARTAVLITLARAGGLLTGPFGREAVEAAEARIASITAGLRVGRATRDAIAAHESAVAAALMISGMPLSGW